MTHPSRVGLVLAAGGSGSRFGGETPKQFLTIRGKALYLLSLESFVGEVKEVSVVVPATWVERVEAQVGRLVGMEIRVAAGGGSRQASVERGLEVLPQSLDVILVHDAARPFVTRPVVRSVIAGAISHRACVPVVEVPDTVKEVEADRIIRTLCRDGLRLAQTPQGFEADLLRRAFAKARHDGFDGTDESSLVERLGIPVHLVNGDPGNIKVTWGKDFLGSLETDPPGGRDPK